MARNRRRNSLSSTFKDYMVPIIGGVLILVLIYSFLGKDGTTDSTKTGGSGSETDIIFNEDDTVAYIVYPGDVREKIDDNISLYAGETIVIESGSVELKPEDGNTINLNKIAEFQIQEDGSYQLFSSDAWIQVQNDTSISMRYANIDAPAGSVVSLTQNEAGSTIYVLAGDVRVENLAKVNTLVPQGQKLSISRLNAAKEDFEIAGERGSIDSYFKGSDWFIANQGSTTTLSAADVSSTSSVGFEDSGNTGSGSSTDLSESTGGVSTRYLQFQKLQDEITLSEGSMDIQGKILSDDVSSITVNNIQVEIDSEKNFSLTGVGLPNTVNDLVIKVYDSTQSVVDKQVYSVYSSADGATQNTGAATVNSTLQGGGTTYKADATKFGFNAPSTSGKFSTTSSEVTIRGYTTAPGVARVQVNGFTLNSFNGTNWRYHAFKRFTTLKEGSNQYKIDYYDANGKIMYTDYYTIVKSSAAPASTPAPAATNTATTTQEISTPPITESEGSEEALFSD